MPTDSENYPFQARGNTPGAAQATESRALEGAGSAALRRPLAAPLRHGRRP